MALDLSQYSIQELQDLLGQIKAKGSDASQEQAATTPQVPLSDIRIQFRKEMEANPAVYKKLLASTDAEVGDQDEKSKIAYMESVMNRAKARGMTLEETLSDSSYYPKATLDRLNRPVTVDMHENLNPLIHRVLEGSNITNFATGNESGSERSGGAPITYKSPGGYERFVLENPDKAWTKNVSSGGGPDLGVSGTTIELPEDLSTYKLPTGKITTEDITKGARYQALQIAKGLQDAGTPLTAGEFKKLMLSQYSAIEKAQAPAELKEIPGQQLEGLSVYANNFDILKNLQKYHADAVDKGAPGFGSWTEAALGGPLHMGQTTQEGIKFNTALEASVSQIARGLGGQTGVLTDKDLEVTRRYLPQPGDSKETAANKVRVLQDQTKDMLRRKLDFYQSSGYQTAGLEKVYSSLTDRLNEENQKSANAPGTDQKQKQNATDNLASKLEDLTRKKGQSTNPQINEWTKGFFGQ
jgi:hypothetical protein